MNFKTVYASEQYVDEKLASLSGGGSSNVSTPDWNQNDSTATDYIKNRPFYSSSSETDLIVFSTSSSDWHINNNGPIASGEFYNTSYVNTFTVGETYTAVINGIKYTDVAKDATAEWGSSAVAIGQVESLLTDDITNFTYTIINSDNMLMIYYKSDVAPTECKLVSLTEEIKKIDPKYLPDMDGYATEEFATNAAAAIKDDLLNGAGEAYDTLKELGELIDANHDALEALETIANGKADADHTHDDKYITKDETNAIQLITIEEIDQICNTGIQFANLDEVNF